MSDVKRVWIVQFGDASGPSPVLLNHRQWTGDRYWPYVEVYESWGDAFKRLGELKDMGVVAFFKEVGVHPDSAGRSDREDD